ncbi:MAG: ATP-dependent nuclease subunit B, partial [Oscillospiraceae bacterium]
MLTLLIGRAGSGKSDFLVTQICQSTQRRQLLIVPEQFSHEAERRLCAVGGNGISRHGEVLSFTRLYNRVCAVCGGGAAPSLDGGGRLLLMHNAVGQVAAHLSVYARPSQKPQFLSGLLTTLDECKSYCVTPEDLGEAASQTDGLEGQKLADLALIFGAYEALCARAAADPRDQLTKLAARLKESGFARGLDIYIDGFTDFTPQERLVLSALLRDAHGVTVALTCDKLEEETEDIFSPARRTGKLLLRLAEDCRVPAQTVHPPKREEHKALPLQWLEEHLMDSVIVPQEGPCPNVELFAANSPWSEMEWAAARILELVQ